MPTTVRFPVDGSAPGVDATSQRVTPGDTTTLPLPVLVGLPVTETARQVNVRLARVEPTGSLTILVDRRLVVGAPADTSGSQVVATTDADGTVRLTTTVRLTRAESRACGNAAGYSRAEYQRIDAGGRVRTDTVHAGVLWAEPLELLTDDTDNAGGGGSSVILPIARRIAPVGGTTTVAATAAGLAITYTSSDPSVATVDAATGVVTGVARGTATITASALGRTSATATVTVIPLTILRDTRVDRLTPRYRVARTQGPALRARDGGPYPVFRDWGLWGTATDSRVGVALERAAGYWGSAVVVATGTAAPLGEVETYGVAQRRTARYTIAAGPTRATPVVVGDVVTLPGGTSPTERGTIRVFVRVRCRAGSDASVGQRLRLVLTTSTIGPYNSAYEEAARVADVAVTLTPTGQTWASPTLELTAGQNVWVGLVVPADATGATDVVFEPAPDGGAPAAEVVLGEAPADVRDDGQRSTIHRTLGEWTPEPTKYLIRVSDRFGGDYGWDRRSGVTIVRSDAPHPDPATGGIERVTLAAGGYVGVANVATAPAGDTIGTPPQVGRAHWVHLLALGDGQYARSADGAVAPVAGTTPAALPANGAYVARWTATGGPLSGFTFSTPLVREPLPGCPTWLGLYRARTPIGAASPSPVTGCTAFHVEIVNSTSAPVTALWARVQAEREQYEEARTTPGYANPIPLRTYTFAGVRATAVIPNYPQAALVLTAAAGSAAADSLWPWSPADALAAAIAESVTMDYKSFETGPAGSASRTALLEIVAAPAGVLPGGTAGYGVRGRLFDQSTTDARSDSRALVRSASDLAPYVPHRTAVAWAGYQIARLLSDGAPASPADLPAGSATGTAPWVFDAGPEQGEAVWSGSDRDFSLSRKGWVRRQAFANVALTDAELAALHAAWAAEDAG